MATVLGLIIVMKANAFLALITAAMIVSLMAPGPIQDKFSRVATAFGSSAGGIGIVIALAAIIGKCMLDSGAADRVVRAFMNLFGERRAPIALMGSGFVLAIPVFFDTVFYLLVPLGRSLFRKTGRNYLLYVMAIATGGAITHTLVPPTPGPLLVADQLSVDKGLMILVGAAVAFPAACAGLMFASFMNRIMPLPMRPLGSTPEPEPIPDDKLPSLWLALAPVVLPVLLISTNTVCSTLADGQRAAQLQTEDILDWDAFRDQIQTDAQAEVVTPGKHLIDTIRDDSLPTSAAREETIALLLHEEPLSAEQQASVVTGLNQFLLLDRSFPDGSALLTILPADPAAALARQDRARLKPVMVERMNRLYLEAIFPEDVVAPHEWETDIREAANLTSMIGDPNFALLLSAIIAMWTLAIQRGLSLKELASSIEVALMSGGLIILITAAGGAFGNMLTVAGVGSAIQTLFAGGAGSSGSAGSVQLMVLILGFGVAAVLKIAQGSSTVAMITSAGMLASLAVPETLGFHPVYLAASIGSGSLIGSWMNDSGFWIFAKMSGLTEVEALKTWTPLLLILGGVSFAMTLILAMVMPLV